MDKLHLLIADITPQGLSLACEATAEELGLNETDDKLAGPLSVHLELSYHEPDFSVSGSVDGTAVRQCVRCLGEFEDPLSMTVYADFVRQIEPRPKPTGVVNRGKREKRASEADSDVSQTDEEDEIYYYQGDQVDLAPMLREQIILAAPIQPLCSEDCAGLCSRCGQNLNEERCACAPEPVNNPFRVLREGERKGRT
jgi:uncharacterized protein